MRMDPLKQYARLHQQLTGEKARLEARLAEINAVLEPGIQFPSAALDKITGEYLESMMEAPASGRGRGRRKGNAMTMRDAVIQALSKGPVARKDLVAAVEAVGYKFKTRKPLNSIGSILYARNTPVRSKDGKFYLADGVQPKSMENDFPTAAPVKRKRARMSARARANIRAAQKARRERERAGKQ